MANHFIALVLYDLPSTTKHDFKAYREFRSQLKKMGFYQLQASVYITKLYSIESKRSLPSKLKSILPKRGDIRLIMITEKQFSNSFHLLGNKKFCEILLDPKHPIIEL